MNCYEMQHSDPCRKQVWRGTINLVPSFITTGPPTTHQCLHQELVTPFGSTTTQTWQSFKKPHAGRKNNCNSNNKKKKIHSNKLHKRDCTKAKCVARHNTHRIRVPQRNLSGKNTGCPLHLSQRSGPFTTETEGPLDSQIELNMSALQMTHRQK